MTTVMTSSREELIFDVEKEGSVWRAKLSSLGIGWSVPFL